MGMGVLGTVGIPWHPPALQTSGSHQAEDALEPGELGADVWWPRPELLCYGHHSSPGFICEGAEGKEAVEPENSAKANLAPPQCGERGWRWGAGPQLHPG